MSDTKLEMENRMKARLMMTVPMVTLLAGGAWAASPADSSHPILAQAATQQQDTQRPAAAQRETMPRAGSAPVSEACMKELDEVREKMADRGYGIDRRDFGTLYEAAMVFGRNGQDDACSEVVAGMEELAEKSPREMTQEQRTRYEQEMKSARPFSELGMFRAGDMIGREVVGRDGESLGDVDEVIISADGGVQHILIGTGGFLGMGEQQVPVKFDQLRMAGDDRIVLNVDSERFENAPRYDRDEFDRGTDNWSRDVDSWWTDNVRR